MRVSSIQNPPNGRSADKAFDQPFRFALLTGWLILIFALGGSSRPDAEQLQVLRPLSVLMAAIGSATVAADQVRAYKGLLAFILLLLIYVGAQLIPLPPAMWHALPGREIIIGIDRDAALGSVWRPVSMAPDWTLNAFWSLFVPISLILNAVQLTQRDLFRLNATILCLGFLSALLAVAQLLGPSEGPLYFYRTTNAGAAVGLFANRNHQAIFLASMVPFAFLWVSGLGQARQTHAETAYGSLPLGLLTMAYVTFIALLLLVTGSRAGLIGLCIGLIASTLLLKTARSSQNKGAAAGWRQYRPLLSLVAAGALVLIISVVQGRALALERLLESDPLSDERSKILPTVVDIIQVYFPVGSGIGTYEPIFQIHEPDSLLQPNYSNHVHNDWLELVATGGVAAVLLTLVGICAFAFQAGLVWRDSTAVDQVRATKLTGIIVVVMLAMGSIGDYPVRVPSLAALVSLMMVWIYRPEPAVTMTK